MANHALHNVSSLTLSDPRVEYRTGHLGAGVLQEPYVAHAAIGECNEGNLTWS